MQSCSTTVPDVALRRSRSLRRHWARLAVASGMRGGGGAGTGPTQQGWSRQAIARQPSGANGPMVFGALQFTHAGLDRVKPGTWKRRLGIIATSRRTALPRLRSNAKKKRGSSARLQADGRPRASAGRAHRGWGPCLPMSGHPAVTNRRMRFRRDALKLFQGQQHSGSTPAEAESRRPDHDEKHIALLYRLRPVPGRGLASGEALGPEVPRLNTSPRPALPSDRLRQGLRGYVQGGHGLPGSFLLPSSTTPAIDAKEKAAGQLLGAARKGGRSPRRRAI